jgi:tripartite-type tricarboxylate transporter receptor subunit TctC
MSTVVRLLRAGEPAARDRDALHAETTKILAMPDVKKRLEGLAGEPGADERRGVRAMAKADYDRSGKLVRDAGIKGEQ